MGHVLVTNFLKELMELNFVCDCRFLQITEVFFELSDLRQYFFFYKRVKLLAFLQAIYHSHLLPRTILLKNFTH